jgi:hypothetical protein
LKNTVSFQIADSIEEKILLYILSCGCINTVYKSLKERDQPLNEEDNQETIADLVLHLTNIETKLHGAETKSKSC